MVAKYTLELTGIVLGAVVGFSYWYFVGCASETCPITSSPINSSIYGALMGGLLASMLRKERKQNKKPNQ